MQRAQSLNGPDRVAARTVAPGRCAAVVLAIVLILQAIAVSDGAAAKTVARDDHRRTALVIGNSDYRHVQKLVNPSRDARTIAAKLAQIGFDVTTVIDGDTAALHDALSTFSRRSKNSDIALFFYAGHGVQINGENYFLPVSTTAGPNDSILRQALSLNEVRRQLQRASPALTIFILDACRDNPFGAGTRGQPWETKAPVVLKPGLAQVQSAAGMLIAYATQPGKFAYDGKGEHSPFTASLLRYIDEPGLEIRLMLGRVREDVVAHTGGGQIPWVEEAVLGEFYFTERTQPKGAALAQAQADDVTFWRSIWRSTDAKDYEAYLARYPKGAYATLAANRIKALKASVRETAVTALADGEDWNVDQWRHVQNSLYWLGYYNGKPTGIADTGVLNAVQAFQAGAYEKPTGRLTAPQAGRLHTAAANSLITLGERLSDRIVFDRVRMRSIDRGINEIALPAYEQLEQKLPRDANGQKILAEAKGQIDTMRRQYAAVKDQYDRATNSYVTVVAAAGAGYASQIRQFRFGTMRLSDATATRTEALTSRRAIFVKHALDYASEGKINEKQWIDDLR